VAVMASWHVLPSWPRATSEAQVVGLTDHDCPSKKTVEIQILRDPLR
jgi:hypothetical protein